ncbi:MAG TPA: hypothetical protein VG389_15945, partial [Myxococcota bacterium]|nr:hypothetical protein [Myxococcota bacterium]
MAEPAAAAAAAAGAPLLEARVSRAGLAFALLLAASSAVVAAGALMGVIADDAGDVARLALAAAAAVSAALFGLWAAACARGRLTVYEWGLERSTLRGTVALPFDEIATIVLPALAQAHIDPLGRAVVHGKAGQRAPMGLLDHATTMKAMRMVLQRALPRLGREAHDALAAGTALQFGPLSVTRAGLLHAGTLLAWKQIDRASFSPRGLRVFPLDRPDLIIVLPLKTPNLHVVEWLCAHPPAGAEGAAAAPGTAAGDAARAAASAGAGAATGAPIPGGTGTAPRVLGFPDEDAELGRIVTGRPRRPGGVRAGQVMLVAGVAGVLPLFVLAGDVAPAVPALSLVLAGVGVAVWINFRHFGLGIYEHGLRDRRGAALRWTDVEHVKHELVDVYVNGAYSGRRVTLSLRGRDGTSVGLAGVGDQDEGV